MEAGSDPVMCGELIAAVRGELLVEVVSARFKLVAVEAVSVGLVSLEEVEGAEMGAAGWVMAAEEAESVWSLDAGPRALAAAGERGLGVTGEVVVMGTSSAPKLGG